MPARSTTAPTVRTLERATATFEIYELAPNGGGLKCRILGDPELFSDSRFAEANCQTVRFPATSFGVGLGAFGDSFAECRDHFGEFLSVAGAAAYLPTDGSNIPDFLVSEGTFVPELQVLYGAVCEGTFSSLARFESKPDARAVGLTELVSAALDLSGSDVTGLVVIAESAGLVGASLRRPPVNGSGAPFAHPEDSKVALLHNGARVHAGADGSGGSGGSVGGGRVESHPQAVERSGRCGRTLSRSRIFISATSTGDCGSRKDRP